jgi:hypothetical protein
MGDIKRTDIYIFKICVGSSGDSANGESPYRIIAVAGGTMLDEFARLIVTSFEFDFDHAYGFYDNLTRWNHSDEGYEAFADMDEESRHPGVKSTPIETAFPAPGKRMLFLYDYGDEWNFIVELTGIEEPEEGENYPRLLESIGDPPPQYEYDRDELDDRGEFSVDDYDINDEEEGQYVEEAEGRIREILDVDDEDEIPSVSPDTLKAFYKYLADRLTFPFNALYYDEDEDRETMISVTGLQPYDETEAQSHGLLCACSRGKQKLVIALAEIEPDEKDPNYLAVDDYCFWYWEYV